MRPLKAVVALSIAVALSGCLSAADERAKALAVAQDRCEGQGKQLQTVNIAQQGIANVTRFSTTIDFMCLGPGEPGYVPPPAK